MMPAEIVVVVSTYLPDEARLKCLTDTVHSLYDNLKAPVPLRFHFADDGSSDKMQGELNYLSQLQELGWNGTTVSVTPRKGIGGSLNRALRAIKSEKAFTLWMYTTDDWQLTKELDLSSAVDLIARFDYDYVRLLPAHPNLMCQTMFSLGHGWWLHMLPGSGFTFATRPFLANIRFYDENGEFDEGLNAYDTERLYAEKVNRLACTRMAIDLDLHGPWNHIGDVSPVGQIEPVASNA